MFTFTKSRFAGLALAALLCLAAIPARSVEPLAVPDPAMTSTTAEPAFAPVSVVPDSVVASRGTRIAIIVIGLAIAAAMLIWVFRRDKTVYTDPTINPNNNVVNPTLNEPGSNLPGKRNPIA
ncbi:MAG: hypothetical protein LUE17_00290 [Planctomycetaceae bacterium]|nr:hypothetical protein [Planctomycetaceae bacterium]